MAKLETREQWLSGGVDALRTYFADLGYELPKTVRVSCGWPSRMALSRRKRRIGECWKRAASADGVQQIFITPLIDSGVEALDVLAHELVHAAIDPFHGHGGKFAKAAKELGLTNGKPTSAGAGEELRKLLEKIAKKLGDYPHSALNATAEMKKQSTRLLKVSCKECGYVARVTNKWLEATGAPLCPCNTEPMQEE